MKRPASSRLLWCIALLCACPGCLGVRHSTHVVRENEKPRPVRFESEQAKNLFDSGVKQMQAHKESSNVQVSFSWFFWKSQDEKLSDNAVFNDEAGLCDANGDGVIGVQEAYAYRARVDEKMQLIEAQALARAKESKSFMDAQAPAQAQIKPPEPENRPIMRNVSANGADYSRQ